MRDPHPIWIVLLIIATITSISGFIITTAELVGPTLNAVIRWLFVISQVERWALFASGLLLCITCWRGLSRRM